MDIKMTKKLLDNYRKTKREIPILELELVDMQSGSNGLNNSTVYDYRDGFPRPQSVIGFDWPLYERRKKVLDGKKKNVEAVKLWIEAIEDGQTRCIFKMFYLDDMGWERIAVKTGYTSSPDYPRLMIRDKYLKERKII